MPITEKKENGKIKESAVQYVATLVDIDLGSLIGSFHKLQHHIGMKSELETEEGKEKYDINTLLKLYQCTGNIIWGYHSIYDKNAQDLYEFFYQEKGLDKDAYYACQFPIDWTRFKKERVKEKLVKESLEDLTILDKKIVNYMQENFQTFRKCLKVKVKAKNTFSKKLC